MKWCDPVVTARQPLRYVVPRRHYRARLPIELPRLAAARTNFPSEVAEIALVTQLATRWIGGGA
jgi:hypothetical protein